MELYLNVTVFFFLLGIEKQAFLCLCLLVCLFGVYAPHLHCVHVYLYTCICAGMHMCDQSVKVRS